MGAEQSKHKGENSTVLFNTIPGEETINIVEELQDCQEVNKLNMATQIDEVHKISQSLNTSIIKGKNIVEKFIRGKGKEKTSTFRALRANSGGVSKPQKSRKLCNQWEKVKAIINSTDYNNNNDWDT